MHVIIVGAGPTGAALAYLLTRRGIEVTLLEREKTFDRTFRGEALMPGGVDAIAQMGLETEFAQLPQRAVECSELHVDGTLVFRYDGSEMRGANAVRVVSQPALLDMLTTAAARSPAFQLRLGASVQRLQVETESVRVSARCNGQEETIAGDFVIGADGRGSIVRAQAGLSLTRLAFPFDVAWFSVPMPPTQREDPRFQAFTRKGRTVVLYPSWNDSLRVGLNVAPKEAGTPPSKFQLVEEIAGIIGEPYAAFLRENADAIAEPVRLKVLFGRAPRWSAPRVLLLGDAAHPMSPVRAQGINLALRDALVAANHIVPAASDGLEAVQNAAESIQREREPEVEESQRLQLASSRPPPPARSPLLRATLLPLLRRLGVMRRQFLKSEMPLRHGICDVRLSV